MAASLKLHDVRRRLWQVSCGRRVSVRRVSGSRLDRDAVAQKKTDTGSASTPKPSIPMVPRHRDPHAVLKALSATITPLEHPHTMGRSLADPLSSRSRRQLIECKMSERAGQKAAGYFIKKFPDLFPLRVAVPYLKEVDKIVIVSNEEDRLQYLIQSESLNDALTLYNELKDKGVSLETQNGLLSLLAYDGRGNAKGSRSEKSSVPDEDLDANDLKELKLNLKALELDEQPGSKDYYRWSMKNKAEEMFAQMKERDHVTYSIMVQGAIKYGGYKRAFQLWREAQQKNYRLTVDGYNHILQVLAVAHNFRDRWNMTTEILKTMSQSPPIQPNNTTFNLMLEINDDIDIAKSIMREMNHLKLQPDLTTLLRLLQVFIRYGKYGILEGVVEHIESNTEILRARNTTDLLFFTTAMKVAKMIPSCELAIRLNNLAKKDNWYLVESIGLFISHYLVAIASNQTNMTQVRRLFKEVVPQVCMPRDWVYCEIFRQCSKCGDSDSAIFFWNEFTKCRGVLDKVDTLNELMLALDKGLDDKEKLPAITGVVEEVWRKIEFHNFLVSQKILNTTIKTCIKNNEIQKVWHYFQAYGVPGFQVSKQLLDVYMEQGDRERVMAILRQMMAKGYVMSATAVADVCEKCLVSNDERLTLLDGFAKNMAMSRGNAGTILANVYGDRRQEKYHQQ